MKPVAPGQPSHKPIRSSGFEESPHTKSPLEWWFVHGYFEADTLSRKYFMTSFFRHRLEGAHDAHSFLLAHLDTKPFDNQTVSRIDFALIDQLYSIH